PSSVVHTPRQGPGGKDCAEACGAKLRPSTKARQIIKARMRSPRSCTGRETAPGPRMAQWLGSQRSKDVEDAGAPWQESLRGGRHFPIADCVADMRGAHRVRGELVVVPRGAGAALDRRG